MFDVTGLIGAVRRAVMLAALAGIVAASFVPPSIIAPGRWNMGHVPAYALLTVTALLVLRGRIGGTSAAVGAILSVSLIGLVIELLQPFVGRTAQWQDVANNEIGVVVGAALCLACRHGERRTAYGGVQGIVAVKCGPARK